MLLEASHRDYGGTAFIEMGVVLPGDGEVKWNSEPK